MKLLELGQRSTLGYEDAVRIQNISEWNYFDYLPGDFDAIYAHPDDDEVTSTLVILARFMAKRWVVKGVTLPGLDEFRRGDVYTNMSDPSEILTELSEPGTPSTRCPSDDELDNACVHEAFPAQAEAH